MPGPGLLLAGASLASGALSSNAAGKAADSSRRAAVAANNLQKEQFDQTTQNYAPFLGAGRDAMAAYLFEMGLGPRPTFGGTAPKIETINIPGTPGTSTGGGLNTGTILNGIISGGGIGAPKAGQTGGTPGTQQYKVGDKTFTTLAEAETYANANKTGATQYGGYSQSPMAKYLMQEGVDSIEGSAAAGGGLYSGATLAALEGNRKQVIQADTADYFSKLFGLTNMGMAAAGNQAGAGAQYAGNVGSNMQNYAANSGNAAMAKAQGWNSTLGDMAGIAGYFSGQSNPMAAYASPTMASPRPQPNPFY